MINVVPHVGDFNEDDTVRHYWGSAATTGASVNRATDGTVQVYKDGGLTQSTAGVTDTEGFDSLTGVHLVAINTAADGTFYSAGSDFLVVLAGATIDSQTVNVPLFSFSIENRVARADVILMNGSPYTPTSTVQAVVEEVEPDAVDEIWAKVQAEPSGTPAFGDSMAAMMAWLLMLSRNKLIITSTSIRVRNDADSGDVAEATQNDGGGTYTRGEFA